jgi:hypothetical protein
VLGIILLALNSSDNKRTLPKAHEASFGDEVLVTDNPIGCLTEEVYEKMAQFDTRSI